MTKVTQNLKMRLGAIALGASTVSAASDAHAFATGITSTGEGFQNVTANLTASLQDITGLISAICYITGLGLALLGVLKIKDHVENPTQTPLKDGAIRLLVGGALFSLPMLMEVMSTAFGNNGEVVNVTKVKNVNLGKMVS